MSQLATRNFCEFTRHTKLIDSILFSTRSFVDFEQPIDPGVSYAEQQRQELTIEELEDIIDSDRRCVLDCHVACRNCASSLGKNIKRRVWDDEMWRLFFLPFG